MEFIALDDAHMITLFILFLEEIFNIIIYIQLMVYNFNNIF